MFQSVIEWTIPLVMLPVVAHRHQPAAAIAWLVLILFQPWLGLVLYLLVGDNVVIRQRTKTYCQRIKEIRSLDFLRTQQAHHLERVPDPRWMSLVEITQRLVCMPVLGGNAVEFLDDGNEVIDRIVEDIGAAERHVHMLFYIYEDDAVGWRVAQAMADAAARGVRCRLAVDAIGARVMLGELAEWLGAHGVEVHALMPVNPFRRHLTRLDLRNHRKLIVVDGRVGYTGSQNIEDKDYDSGRADAWHDLMVRVTGPAVIQMQMVFIEDWTFASDHILEGPAVFPETQTVGETSIQVVPSGPMDSTTALRDLLIEAIYGARRRVIITSPYFIPDEPLLVALHLASTRGVRVDLIIPRTADHPVVGAVARAHFDSLLQSGVRIYFHKGVLHSKTMSVDDTIAVVGTANFDHRSFFLHFELSLLLYGADITAKLRAKQLVYIEQSHELEPGQWSNRSRLKQRRDEILKLLSPLL